MMTDAEIRAAIVDMREAAHRAGTLSSLWDVIFDCEALLKGGRTLVPRETIEDMVRDFYGSVPTTEENTHGR